MCVNDGKIAAIDTQLADLRKERDRYEEVLGKCDNSLESLDCITNSLKSIGSYCTEVSASGPYDLGESSKYATEFNNIMSDIEDKKSMFQLALTDIRDEIDGLEADKTRLKLNTPCGKCSECCPPASTDVYGNGIYSGYTGGYWRNR